MADDDRKILFLSFAETLRMIADDRITKVRLTSGDHYYREIAEGLYYLDYGEKLIRSPASFNYEGYFNLSAYKKLKFYLEIFKARFPSSKAQRIEVASTDEEKLLAEEYTGHVLYREP